MKFVFNEFYFNIYGIMMLTAFISSSAIIYIILRKNNIKRETIFLSFMLCITCIIYGAKYFTIITSQNENISFLNAGLSSYGGAIGLIISVIIFNFIYKKDSKLFINTYFLVIPLMYSISKLGCFFVGCCHGIPYNGLFSVIYYNKITESTSFFPVQLSETIAFAIIFIIGLYLLKRNNKFFIEFLMISCAIAKFSLDFLRESHIGQILSINQILSIAFFIIGLFFIFLKSRENLEIYKKFRNLKI